MLKKVCFLGLFFWGIIASAQINSNEFRKKTFTLQKDTLLFDTAAINSQRFRVFDSNNKLILQKNYQVNYLKAQLIINAEKYPNISIAYFLFPDFITKTYQAFNDSIIVPNTSNTKKLYSLTSNQPSTNIDLFEGLETKGTIARGLTIGNNQNSVVNSTLDLNISGKLSDDITLRANIYDTNIPLQDNGYSQSITDFDRIFIELEHKNWRVKAGDLDLENNESYFLQFTKKVSGLEVAAKLNKTTVSASGAIVRGRFADFEFMGKEGNQGPYRIITPQQIRVIIVASSDILYANGIELKRGKDKDYTIDYNTAEIRFNTTFPITSDLRFHIDYQYADRNYTRFVSYDKANYTNDKLSINGYFYHENDVKNQPVQQQLTIQQKQILANAGNNSDKMVSQSAYREAYSDSRILYKKTTIGTTETFVYSTDATDDLYAVTFTFVGSNKGDYKLNKTIAIGNIFSYVGTNLGSYNPVIRLVAPTKSQVIATNITYNPSKKTRIFAELAMSDNDMNLFSTIDDERNKGAATKLKWHQILIDKKWQLSSNVNYEFVHQDFTSEQRFEPVEFERDWNLVNPSGSSQQINTSIRLQNKKSGFFEYQFNYLSYTDNYKGIKHNFTTELQSNNTSVTSDLSFLSSSSSSEENEFLKATIGIEHQFKNSWIGTLLQIETNKRTDNNTNSLSLLSHRFKEFETYFGLGDSSKVFAKIGYKYRETDSVKSGNFARANTRNTYYLQSKIIQNSKASLSIFANYSHTKYPFSVAKKSLNSKIVYHQKIAANFINLATVYETESGNIPQQDYVYIKTEPGQGYYTWIDYNNNGIKEFNEFEVAVYKDQATYLRIALPNINFIDTQRAKWSQSVSINPSQWASKSGIKKGISHFYNEFYFTIDNEQKRTTNQFYINPFQRDEPQLLGLHYTLRNSLYLNKNLQHYSFIYTYGTSKNKQLYSIGNQESNTLLQQVTLQQKLTKFWLFDLKTSYAEDELTTENFVNRNYKIQIKHVAPSIRFLYNKNNRFSLNYQYKFKENSLLDYEKLTQQNFGVSYFYLGKESGQFSAEINVFDNRFTGNQNSPVAYQMLEGLQAGKNYTWSLLYQQKINSFLSLNLNYLGRKSENSKTIHTGSVQLLANF